MDDPLKQKAVPLAAETVLWFEFLLDPELITKHLNKPNPEPCAMDLMTQFISMTPDTGPAPQYDLTKVEGENGNGGGTAALPVTPGALPPIVDHTEGLVISRKQLALKILTLKVATWIKWNLDLMEKSLTIPKQLFLLRDLCTLSFGRFVSIPLAADFNTKISADGNENAARFALTFYHRWVLRLQILKDIAKKSASPIMFLPMEPMHQYYAPEISPATSIEYLQNLCKSQEPFYVFTYDTFVPLHPNCESTQQNFHKMKQISLAELHAQIYFDLVNFYLYTKQYHLAREAVYECRRSLIDAKREYELIYRDAKDFLYCNLNEDELEGYLMACGASAKSVSLLERFNLSQLTGYQDIVAILQQDNVQRQIPYECRRLMELDIEGALSQGMPIADGKSLEMQVAALNLVRSIFEEGNIFAGVDYFQKYKAFNCFAAVVEAAGSILPHCTVPEQNRVKNFLIDCIVKHTNNAKFVALLQPLELLFAKAELEELKRQTLEEELTVPPLALQNEWKFNTKIPRIEVGSLERQLISCTNSNTVRKLLVKLAATNPTKPLWTVNPSWEIATPIKSLLMSMQRGFLQDFAYVLLGKSRELSAKSDFISAVSMLSVLKSETQRPEMSSNTIVMKLGKLVNWEILLIQITQCLDEWNRKTLDLQSLGNRCKQCLNSLQCGDNIIPRIEIVESCSLMLLNLSDWSSLMYLDKRLPQLELSIAFAATFIDMEKMKGPKKICRDAWDIVLSMFVNTKRGGGTGGGSGSSHNSPGLAVSTNLHPFLKRIRHQMVFSLAISLLGKIHNILKDDPNHDLNGEYMQLWPTSISNPMAYSIRSVSETLQWLLTEALKYYPQTIPWLKMKGDLELAIGNNEAAMRCYVNALVTGTEYCTFPLQRNIADDYVIRKMIRCSSNLGCHMQATVLCQFLEEIDYTIVFKNLTEKTSNFTDAMDAYYNCIWDTTLLEFIINLHAKKGEHSRKLEAIAVMGTLELNANNNDEIKREAAAIRKTRFLRALAKQYLL